MDKKSDQGEWNSHMAHLKMSPERKKGAAIKSLSLLKKLRKALSDRKGNDILAFDVRRISDLSDYILLASAGSTPHLRAMIEEMECVLKSENVRQYRISGEPLSGWMVVDCTDVIVHVLLQEKRDYYALEELWEKVPRVR